MTHTHPDQSRRVHVPGRSAAASPGTSAPSAAVAVHPYQYIAGARNPIAGATVSRDHVKDGERKPIGKSESAEGG
jgi:hypothetical protein